MERFCRWCGSEMLSFAGGKTQSSSSICSSCVEDLEPSLAGVGLELAQADTATSGR
jgi:hypothetical protein